MKKNSAAIESAMNTAELLCQATGESCDDKIQMHSFSRAASIMWGAALVALVEGGIPENKAVDLLQSKWSRHILDGIGHDLLAGVGKKIAAMADLGYIE